MWRSLVARTLGVGEAPSSNLGIPISKGSRLLQESRAFSLLPVSRVNAPVSRAQSFACESPSHHLLSHQTSAAPRVNGKTVKNM